MEESDDKLFIDSTWVEEGVHAVKKCLLGKMLINKPYRIEGMQAGFQKLWRLKSVLTIQNLGDYMFAFHFEDDSEKDRIPSGASSEDAEHFRWWRKRTVVKEKLGDFSGAQIGNQNLVSSESPKLVEVPVFTFTQQTQSCTPVLRSKRHTGSITKTRSNIDVSRRLASKKRTSHGGDKEQGVKKLRDHELVCVDSIPEEMAEVGSIQPRQTP
ncbi:hypothetical protein PTKIN_Ptkin01aG0245400 [Pterospermum kingtungense]